VRFFLIQSGDGALPARSPALRGEGRLDQKPPPFGNRSEIFANGPRARGTLIALQEEFLVWRYPLDFAEGLVFVERLPAQKMCPPRSLQPCGDISILDKSEVSERNPYENEMRILLKQKGCVS
jgi:hypothetical protein